MNPLLFGLIGFLLVVVIHAIYSAYKRRKRFLREWLR